MGILNKKAVVLTPEAKIEKANGCVKEQRTHFEMIIDEVETAIEEREVAIEELELEVASLEARLNAKLGMIGHAKTQNQVDKAYKQRIEELLG